MGVPFIGADSRFDDTQSGAAVTVTPTGATGFTKERLTDDRPFTVYKMGTAGLSVVVKTDAGSGNTRKVGYFMLIGHNPGMEDLVNMLSGQKEPFPTAALAAFELAIDSWRKLELGIEVKLKNLWRPRELE